MADKGKKKDSKKYTKGDISDNKIDLDQFTFKNSDVTKWSNTNYSLKEQTSTPTLKGMAQLGSTKSPINYYNKKRRTAGSRFRNRRGNA
jgi:hypothetical protein